MIPKPTLVLLTLTLSASLVLGTLGFREVAPENGWLTSFYLAIQLFTMGSGAVEGEIPWSLEFARWLAPAVTLGGLLAAASVVFKEFRRRIGLGLVRSHVVICGAGEKGRFIAEDLLRDPQVSARIVIIEQNPSPGSADELERMGAIVMAGDALDASTLRRARVATASRVVCLAGDDRTNLAIAMVVAGQVPAERSRDPLWIHVHLSDIARRDILERNRALDPASRTQFRIVGFNHFRNLSRCIMDAFPFECDLDGKVAGQVHLILPGLGRAKGGDSESTGELAVAICIQVALVGHYHDGGKVTIHLVGTGAEADRRFLLKRYPGFERCAMLSVHPVPDDDDFAETTGELIDTFDGEAFATVLLAERGEHEALVEALLLGERCSGSDRFRVLLSAPSESPVREIVAEPAPTGEVPLSRWIQFVPTIREACGRDAVFSETLDELARRIHRAWYEGTSARITDAELAGKIEEAETHRRKPSYRPWEDLAEKQRDENRYAADHLKIKIRAAGLDPDDTAGLQESWENLSPETLDRLARVEHERWSAPLWMAGWKPGPRDDARRTHNNLVPYDELDRGTKDYDIEQVRAVPTYLCGG